MFLLSTPAEGALLLLCSDGVSDVLPPTSVLRAVSVAADAHSPGSDAAANVADALVLAAQAAWAERYPGVARDDITVQAVFLLPGGAASGGGA